MFSIYSIKLKVLLEYMVLLKDPESLNVVALRNPNAVLFLSMGHRTHF